MITAVDDYGWLWFLATLSWLLSFLGLRKQQIMMEQSEIVWKERMKISHERIENGSESN